MQITIFYFINFWCEIFKCLVPASFIFIENYCALLFKVYINQNLVHLVNIYMELFVILTIDEIILLLNVITHTLFSWISWTLCQFFAGSISFQVVPTRFRWFQLVPGGSRSFQLVSRFSMYDYKAQIKSRVFLSENKVKETSNNIQIYSFFETYSCRTSRFD